MLWFLLSASSAFFDALKNTFNKLDLAHIDAYLGAWSFRLFTLIFLLPFLFFIKIPTLNPEFWKVLIMVAILNSLSTILYIKAIKLSDLSITIPILSFTPLFILLTSPLF